VVERGLHRTLPHPLGVPSPVLGNPIRFSDTPIRIERPAPMLGQHTDAVLGEVLGMRADAIAALRSEGAL
jgi:crotonobetainyl-CoA:carnitine CoA-transferase CaiB-like acyl-CoA transferase